MKNRLLALALSDTAKSLGASEPEILLWLTQGKMPLFDGLVRVYDSSTPRIEPGWKYETVEKLKPFVDEWRSDNGESCPLLSYDWRAATTELQCSKAELMRWVDEGRLPYDGLVSSFYFTSMSWGHSTTTEGWGNDTIEKAKLLVEEWRLEHKEALKAKQKDRRQKKMQRQKILNSVENSLCD